MSLTDCYDISHSCSQLDGTLTLFQAYESLFSFLFCSGSTHCLFPVFGDINFIHGGEIRRRNIFLLQMQKNSVDETDTASQVIIHQLRNKSSYFSY